MGIIGVSASGLKYSVVNLDYVMDGAIGTEKRSASVCSSNFWMCFNVIIITISGSSLSPFFFVAVLV